MIREDRELLAELARVNRDMASLGMRIIDGSASAAEQSDYAQRLIAAGKRLDRRAQVMGATLIEGEIIDHATIAISPHTALTEDES